MKIYSSTVVQNVYQAYGKNKVGKTQKSGEVGSPGFDIQISNQGKDYHLKIKANSRCESR
jgi:negative regulator of flagellin synthesis FlgM